MKTILITLFVLGVTPFARADYCQYSDEECMAREEEREFREEQRERWAEEDKRRKQREFESYFEKNGDNEESEDDR